MVLRHGRSVHHQRMGLVTTLIGNQGTVVLIVDSRTLCIEAFGELTRCAVIPCHHLAQRQEVTYQGTHTDATGTDEIY